MKPQYMKFFVIVSAILLIIDLYAFKGLWVSVISKISNPSFRTTVIIAYWSITCLFFLLAIRFTTYDFEERDPLNFKYFFWVYGGFGLLLFIPKIIFASFHLAEDISYYSIIGFTKIFNINAHLSRYLLLSKAGIVIGIFAFVSIFYGITFGGYDYRVEKQTLSFTNLPKSFKGLKIVQISDLHVGTLIGNEKRVERAINIVNSLKPDIILFTGDLVNNYAEELKSWQPVLEKLSAPMGKFSILGNHDYGNYYKWKSQEEKVENLKKIKEFHQLIGFRLMLNESIAITKDTADTIYLIGIENWGKPPFPQYGDLKLAMQYVKNGHFKILMSHDPSHWDHEVVDSTNIDLTLSGHTHGMQFGFKIFGKWWSPIKHWYPKWQGLYEENGQYLYVNRGLGFIGLPGRIYMPPEITEITLD
jgi:uncharacterized protein